MFDGQVAHEPDEPQAATLLPAVHTPLAPQQPPLHGWLAVHEGRAVVVRENPRLADGAVHRLGAAARARRQAGAALALPTQVAHVEPTAPQTVCAVPGWQVLDADAQQPDKHGMPTEQVFTQTPFVHPVEVPGQSVASVTHPHWPPPVTALHL